MADNAFTLGGLVKKRAELAGEIEATQARLRKMIVDLESLDGAIRVFDRSYPIDEIRAKRVKDERYQSRRPLGRVVLEILRQGGGPMTAEQIALQLPEALEVKADARLMRHLTERVSRALRNHRRHGEAASSDGDGPFVMWRLV